MSFEHCERCRCEVLPSWKFCGKCGAYCNRGGVKNNRGEDIFRSAYGDVIKKVDESKLRFKSSRRSTTAVLAAYQVINGEKMESTLNVLKEDPIEKYKWKPPEIPTREVAEFDAENITLPIRPGRSEVKPLHNHYLDQLEFEQKTVAILFEPPIVHAERKPIAALWNVPDDSRNKEDATKVIQNQIVTVEEKAPVSIDKPDDVLLDRLEKWPTEMGKRFRKIVYAMRGTLKRCDIDVVKFRQKQRLHHMKSILDELLENIYQAKATLQIVNDEHIMFYSEIEDARLQVLASLTSAMEAVSSASDVIGGGAALVGMMEDRERDDMDAVLRLRELKGTADQIFEKWTQRVTETMGKCVVQYNRFEALIYDTAARIIQHNLACCMERYHRSIR